MCNEVFLASFLDKPCLKGVCLCADRVPGDSLIPVVFQITGGFYELNGHREHMSRNTI
jgi:hypothetical protein